MSDSNGERTCHHVHCSCPVPDAEQAYCSAYCANAEHEDVQVEESVELAACSCGHEDCNQLGQKPRDTEPESGVAMGGGPGSWSPPDAE